MTHKCEYCDKEITPGSKYENVLCTCDIAPESCELPEKIVCNGTLCQFKFQVNYYETQLETLKHDTINATEKLKELNNHFRIMGISPQGLESLIQNHGVNLPGFLFVNKNDRWTWDQMAPDNLVTIGLQFMQVYESMAKLWAQFLNEKAIKVQIKKELLAQTEKNLTIKQAQKILKHENAKLNGTTKLNGTILKRENAKLTKFEKLVAERMKTFNWSQDQAIESLKVMGFPIEECRDLKTLIR